MIQFDEHIFQMGWFNHQLEMIQYSVQWGYTSLRKLPMFFSCFATTGIFISPKINFQGTFGHFAGDVYIHPKTPRVEGCEVCGCSLWWNNSPLSLVMRSHKISSNSPLQWDGIEVFAFMAQLDLFSTYHGIAHHKIYKIGTCFLELVPITLLKKHIQVIQIRDISPKKVVYSPGLLQKSPYIGRDWWNKWNSRMDEYEFREPLVWFFQSKKSCLLDYHELPSGSGTLLGFFL